MIRKGIKVENKDFKLIYLADNLTCSLHHKKSDVIQFLTAHLLVIKDQAPVVQTLDSAIQWINHYPLDNSIGFASVYPLDSDLSGGQRYPSFEQLGPGL